MYNIMEKIKDVLNEINYMKGGLIVGGGLLLLYLVPHALKPTLRRREINKLKKIYKQITPIEIGTIKKNTPSPVWLGGTRRKRVCRSYNKRTIKKLKNKKIKKR